MKYLGDFPADQAIYFAWNTNDGDGASITRSTDGTISVYKDNSNGSSFDTTQVTTGITNDEDFDSLTGVHTCCITTTNAWYETGHDYMVVLSGSTIDTQSVSAVLAHFSIENRVMRGTDSAALAATALSDATWTDTKAGYLDVATSSRNATTPPTVTQIRTEMEKAGTVLNVILQDTGTTIPNQITAQNDLSSADVNTECDMALSDIHLDHLLAVDYDPAAKPGVATALFNELIENDVGVSRYTANALEQVPTPPTVLQIRNEMEGIGTKLTFALEDTAELQGNQADWATATSVTVSDKTGFELSAAGVDAILDGNIEGAHTLRKTMRLLASMLVGKVSGGGTATISFRDIDDSKDRIVMTVTGAGNRTNVVLTED